MTRSTFSGGIIRAGAGGDGVSGGGNPTGGLGGHAFGGAIGQQNGGTTTIANSTFSNLELEAGGGGNAGRGGPGGNGGNAFGGALYQAGSQATLRNITVADNFVLGAPGGSGQGTSTFGIGSGGGLYGPVNVANTIVSGSTAANGDSTTPSGVNCAGAITNSGHNLEFGASSCTGFVPGDPKLDAEANNGGPTQTRALLSGSAAIGTGDPSICAAALPNGAGGIDQRGVARLTGVCSIGAYEAVTAPNPVPVVKPPGSNLGNPASLPAARKPPGPNLGVPASLPPPRP